MSQPIFQFDNSYARLPERFYELIQPTPVKTPQLIVFNRPLADDLAMYYAGLSEAHLAQLFAGNSVPDGATPLAQAYAGHQFAHFVPQLGDGRALLVGEVLNKNQQRCDIQLKGSGPTKFSRRGDGRAALGPVIREYLVSEAMHALGVPTTRSLAFVTTGETVMREGPLPGGVLTRVAASHIRIGTFEYLAARQDFEGVKILADHVIARHYPEAAHQSQPYLALLQNVMAAQARLVAQWMSLGFIHGVMNTDNMTVSGETIDYGPCAFLDQYDPATVYSSIDRHGRYAYQNQPGVALWNLSRLAECLLTLFAAEPAEAVTKAEEVLSGFSEIYENEWQRLMLGKLGVEKKSHDDDVLAQEFLAIMHEDQMDFTNSFRELAKVMAGDDTHYVSHFRKTDNSADKIILWLGRWRARLSQEARELSTIAQDLNSHNPIYIPRNHLVEQAIRAGVEQNDFSKMHELAAALARPYEEQPQFDRYTQPPEEQERVTQTFCGT